MTEYTVRIVEKFSHQVTVEAASEEAAAELAYQLLTNGMPDEEAAARGYDFDSDGFTGEFEVYAD